jgi:hypothetical protein
MENIMPFIVGLGFFAMIFGIVYMVVTARNRERMALIEKGADPRLFESVKKDNSNNIIKWGMFLLGIGLGVVVADMLASSGAMNHGAAYFSMIFIFGGLALVGSHFFLRKQELKDEVKD